MAPENLVRQLALGLNGNNVLVKVVRFRGKTYNQNSSINIECSNLLFKNRVANEVVKVFELFAILFAIPISLIRNSLKYKPDVIILYGVDYFYFVFPFWLFSKILNIKIVRIVTDYYKESTIVPVWWKQPKLFFYRLQFTFFDKYLTGVVTLSSYMANFAQKNGVESSRIIVIPHFIDVEGFCKYAADMKSGNKIRIAFCGTINESNGIFDLIEAFKVVSKDRSDIELVIIGEPLKVVREEIEARLALFSQSYTITGMLPKNKIPEALLSCNILVNPRQAGVFAEAGFPTKLGEYFATKRPVVSTSVGDVKYFFTNKRELVVVEPNNPEMLAEGILFLANNPTEAEIIGNYGYSWAMSNLDYKENAHKLLVYINSDVVN